MPQANPAQRDEPAQPRRHWFQYRLRTLLILTALVAAVVICCGCSQDTDSTAVIAGSSGSTDFAEPVQQLTVPFTEDEARQAVLDVSRKYQIPPRIQLMLTDDTSIAMRLIPPGSLPFRGRVASVRLPYYIAETEITHNQLSGSGVKDWNQDSAPSLPAFFNDIDEIKAYFEYLKGRCGVDARLPTEPEWEFAARAGSAGRYGPDGADPTRFANIDQWNAATEIDGYERRGELSDVLGDDVIAVASFPANAFGIHDAIGNVAEVVYIPKDQLGKGDGSLAFTKGGDYLYSGGFAERDVTTKWSFGPFVGLRPVITVDEGLIKRLSKQKDGVLRAD